MLKNISGLVCFFLLFSTAVNAADMPTTSDAFELCRKNAVELRSGQVIKVEMKHEDGIHVYEFDIRDVENRDWDIECAAETGEIIELEEEVFGVSDPRFSEQMEVSYTEARDIALGLYPGEIIEIEYEIEEDGLAVYEFDIQQSSGREIKLEINARTGEAHDFSREIWQIGYE